MPQELVQQAETSRERQQAFWRRLHSPGHDAAQLLPRDGGWLLRGVAVFEQDRTPACVGYQVELDSNWTARRAEARGFWGDQAVEQVLERRENGWTQNGERLPGLYGLVDVDFGFTPATNMPQLRRLALDVGQEAEFSVAWLDVDEPRLKPLVQRYRRISKLKYDYDSPSVGYRATLKMADSGFVAKYPTLWTMDGERT